MERLSPTEQIARSDASYQPIADLQVWAANIGENETLVSDLARDFEASQAGVDDDSVQAVLSDALGGAALETDAIDGLYRSVADITLSIVEGVISYAAAVAELEKDVDLRLISGQ